LANPIGRNGCKCSSEIPLIRPSGELETSKKGLEFRYSMATMIVRQKRVLNHLKCGRYSMTNIRSAIGS